MSTSNSNIFKLKRYFNIIGLSSTIIAAILLFLFYRLAATGTIVELGERNNLLLAKTVLNSVKVELLEFIHLDNKNLSSKSRSYHIPLSLKKAIQDTMVNTTVTKIVIFNKNGSVIFSTKKSQIGNNESTNEQFKSAINGHIASRLIYHDDFSLFSDASDDDNLVQSYLPIQMSRTSPIQGVFEVYTDVNFIVDRVERTEAIILLGVFIILLLLYSFQAIIVRNSLKAVTQQQSVIDERTRTLELLSSQMLNTQEAEKKKISTLLHEDFSQSLSIVKTKMEIEDSKLEGKPLSNSINILKATIQKLRSLAIDLRPTSLDDFGLIKTINLLSKQYNALYPLLNIEITYDIDEKILPSNMKILIYRLIQETFTKASDVSLTKNISIHLNLVIEGSEISLSFNDIKTSDSSNIYSAMKERTILSGGTFISKQILPDVIKSVTSTWNYE